MTNLKSYRHKRTGLLQQLSPRVADFVPELEEVAPDAKPLAYTPIPKEAVAQVASQTRKAAKAEEK